MDRRKFSKIVPAIAVFLLILLLETAFLGAAGTFLYRSDARQMGMLAEEYPDDEARIAGIFNGKRIPDNSRYENNGLRIFEKYGYSLTDSLFSGNIIFFTLCITGILSLGIFIELLLLFRNMQKTRDTENKMEYLKEKWKESRHFAKQTEEQLRREEQDTKALITDISHQLKTPLASLKMSYELADSSDLTAEERIEFIQKEREEVVRLESLLDIFTHLTRLETGMIRLKPENKSLKRTLTQAVNSIYMKAYEKQIDISMEEFTDIRLPHDSRWTEEVIVNILDNAVKYSPSKTAITIRVSELLSYVMIEIQDQGIGISPSEFQNIFKRFYRGNSPEIKDTNGSGVGLYLARKIIEQQGGTICVKSSGSHTGSNFILTLPKQPADASSKHQTI